MNESDQLKAIRESIDRIDDQLLELISQRARCAQDVARIKQAAGEMNDFYRPDREAQILARIRELNPGPLSDDEAARLIREVMSACLALEKPLTIAYLGPEGTFTQAAALKHFGHSIRSTALGSIDLVFREVESGSAHYGVVPVENSTEGVVNHTLDMFMRSPLHICGEVQQRIELHLLGKAADTSGIKRVYSHQQSLAQCREWLDTNLLQAERIAVSSNGEAARRAAAESDSAAVASETAAELYGLNRLARNIEDEPGNTTRFLVIGKQTVAPSGRDKTSLLVSVRNEPGALYTLLAPFNEHGISMTRIESRPSRRGVWDYVFFVDIEGHAGDAQVAAALAELEQRASVLKVLGSYPRAQV
ncbi:prephenate dehydratase [Thiohalobacter thiocyanaticus]|uniref:Bifunctional chorismate mutase/prephenate dehydratase n=1 Tax=Thiohalobacter thiocyanaticus TaxID=585455 RepID=A0A1Z4VSF0_9GAMM|nr:prephenate dehydratase [Thiohalobacter thiocyanaticus]BAZ94561.1 prephenate dehydratase [Thiohalobacter thiocyanaticus]